MSESNCQVKNKLRKLKPLKDGRTSHRSNSGSSERNNGIFIVTFLNFIRLYIIIHYMTVQEYNKAVEEYSDGIYRFIRSSLKDEERTNDIIQDSYEKLWRNVAEIEYPVVKSWLFSTAYHTMVDIIRRESKMTTLDNSYENDLTHELQYSDLNEILHEALSRLPEQQKTSVLLRDYEGYSYLEIGQITSQSETQVKINIYRGRIALKNYIGKIESII